MTSEAAFGPSRHPMVLGRLLGRVVVNGGLSEVRSQGGGMERALPIPPTLIESNHLDPLLEHTGATPVVGN